MPLIITHGWPSTFFELLKIIPLLTDPASHGGDVYSKDELLTNITIYWATQTISSSVRIYYEGAAPQSLGAGTEGKSGSSLCHRYCSPKILTK